MRACLCVVCMDWCACAFRLTAASQRTTIFLFTIPNFGRRFCLRSWRRLHSCPLASFRLTRRGAKLVSPCRYCGVTRALTTMTQIQMIIVFINIVSSLVAALLFTIGLQLFERTAHYIEYASQITGARPFFFALCVSVG